MAALLTVLSLAGCTASARVGAPATVSSSAAAPAVAAPAGGGRPVPRGFAATAVTFLSTDEAFVLGTAPCAVKPCTSIARTLNRGKTWAGLPAPAVPVSDAEPYTSLPAAVWGVQFASPSLGFVYGTGLWETTDGGQRWRGAASPSGPIIDLEVTDGQLLALIYQHCTIDTGCVNSLYRRALDGGSWHRVTHMGYGSGIATAGRVAAMTDGAGVLVTGDGGLTFAVHPTPCDSPAWTAWSVTVTGPDSLALLCEGGVTSGDRLDQKRVYVSDDLGAHWVLAGSPPPSGGPREISAGTAARLVVGASDFAATWFYYSADGGARWSVAYKVFIGGALFGDLDFTTPADGTVILGPANTDGAGKGAIGRLLLTSDGGATWRAVTW
jgi:photosystem II stability/assembly factor-like uncharacterized protein